MGELFVDTSGWASWVDRSPIHHAQSVAALDSFWSKGGVTVTTNWVLVEMTAQMTSPLRIPKADQIRFLDDLPRDPSVLVLPIDPAIEAAAWTLWRSRPDKRRSLADCASFHVMKERGLAEALTADHHFEQAGFRRLLK